MQEQIAAETKAKEGLRTFLAANEVNKALKEAAKLADREVTD